MPDRICRMACEIGRMEAGIGRMEAVIGRIASGSGPTPQNCWSFVSKKRTSTNSKYSPFHKTLPKFSACINRISVRFYETDSNIL